jgi:cbb3-type cytochrome oxidase subunit 3
MFSPWTGIFSGIIVILICLIGSVLLAFSGFMKENLNPEKRAWLSLILGLYAVFRSVRIYFSLKKIKNDSEKNK